VSNWNAAVQKLSCAYRIAKGVQPFSHPGCVDLVLGHAFLLIHQRKRAAPMGATLRRFGFRRPAKVEKPFRAA
jgi:hypothetical protein